MYPSHPLISLAPLPLPPIATAATAAAIHRPHHRLPPRAAAAPSQTSVLREILLREEARQDKEKLPRAFWGTAAAEVQRRSCTPHQRTGEAIRTKYRKMLLASVPTSKAGIPVR